MIATAALALAMAAPARVALGVWGGWGAFRDSAPPRCFAIAQPRRAGRHGKTRPFASVASRFGRTRRNAVFIRLSAAIDPAAPVTIAIGVRRFRLSGAGTAAWAPDAATDRAIVAAMRGAVGMGVSAIAANGRPFADGYALAGAASAIDAAALGCATRR